MLGSTISTPGSLEPWYYVVHALQRLPTRQITIADASRFCYGTATVECAGVGEAREDADEIVEVPPNTGMVQRHVVALVPGAPIREHGACQSCIDKEFRDILGTTSMAEVNAFTCFGTKAFECPFFRANNERKIHQRQPPRGVCSACHTAVKQVEKWRKRDKSSRVDEIPTYRGSHELQNEKIEFREPVWSAMVTLSECDLSRYEPQFVPGPRAIHKYFVTPVVACHCCENSERKFSHVPLADRVVYLCKSCLAKLSLTAKRIMEHQLDPESILNHELLKPSSSRGVSLTRFLLKARKDVMNNSSESQFLENFRLEFDSVDGPFRIVFMFSRTSTDCGRVALAAHDTADVLRLHEKKYKNTFGVGNVLPGDGTLFVSSTKYSKAGSAWTSLLSSDAAKDPDNGEATPTKHFTFSDLVVDANDVTSTYSKSTVIVFASTIIDFSDNAVHLYNALRTFKAPNRVYIVVQRISKFDHCCGTVSVKELLEAFHKPSALKGSDSASRMLLDSHTRAEEPLRRRGSNNRTGFAVAPHVDTLQPFSQSSQESAAVLMALSQNESQQQTGDVEEEIREKRPTVIEGVEDCPASARKKRKACRTKNPREPPVLLPGVDHARVSRAERSERFGLVATRIDPVRKNDPLLRWTFGLPRRSTRGRGRSRG